MKQIGYRKIGKTYWFEYHCFESEESCDAELWHRTHKKIKILKLVEKGAGRTKKSRLENGQPAVYSVQFNDGRIFDAFEDEILDSKKQFTRPAYKK